MGRDIDDVRGRERHAENLQNWNACAKKALESCATREIVALAFRFVVCSAPFPAAQ